MTSIPSSLRPTASRLSLKWDVDNKLRAADTNDSGTDDIFYRWDALGRRVGRDDGTNHVIYFQDGQQTLADYAAGTAASSPTYTYVYGSYIDEVVLRSGGSGVRYYHRNQQYSVTALTNHRGSIVERYAYRAYGQVTITDASGTAQTASGSNNRYTYTGREWDAVLALYHYRARMHDPAAGRFVSRDPIGFLGSAWNLYRYVGNNAADKSDPSGLLECKTSNAGDTRGIAGETSFMPGETTNPSEAAFALNFLAITTVVTTAPPLVPHVVTIGDIISTINPFSPLPHEVMDLVSQVMDFNTLLLKSGGFANVWTQVQCQKCECTNWAISQAIWGQTSWDWINTGPKRWVRCDLKQTSWGKGKYYVLSNGVLFKAIELADIATIRRECAAQAEDSCAKE